LNERRGRKSRDVLAEGDENLDGSGCGSAPETITSRSSSNGRPRWATLCRHLWHSAGKSASVRAGVLAAYPPGGVIAYLVDYVAMRRLGGAAEYRVIGCFNPARVVDLSVTLDLLDGRWASCGL
jgi:hypothetical protein